MACAALRALGKFDTGAAKQCGHGPQGIVYPAGDGFGLGKGIEGVIKTVDFQSATVLVEKTA